MLYTRRAHLSISNTLNHAGVRRDGGEGHRECARRGHDTRGVKHPPVWRHGADVDALRPPEAPKEVDDLRQLVAGGLHAQGQRDPRWKGI